MPDVPDRTVREDEIAVAIGLLFDEIVETDRVNWVALEIGIQSILRQSLDDTHATMYLLLLSDTVPGVEAVTANAEAGFNATRYADRRSREVARGVVGRLQQGLQNGKSAESIFTQSRADSIAATETTAAASAGEQAARQELEAGDSTAIGALAIFGMLAGETDAVDKIQHDVVETWETEDDARVCPICAPLDGMKRDKWGNEFPTGPPAHPNCRCWLSYEVERKVSR